MPLAPVAQTDRKAIRPPASSATTPAETPSVKASEGRVGRVMMSASFVKRYQMCAMQFTVKESVKSVELAELVELRS